MRPISRRLGFAAIAFSAVKGLLWLALAGAVHSLSTGGP